MDAPPDREIEILRHVLEGDVRKAGTLLVHGYADEVYALCSSMVRDQILAEDLSQEVFTRAFKALPKFRGDASVRTWILRIARNFCIDSLRAQKRAPIHVEEEPDAQPAPEPSVADLITRREDVAAGLRALSETERALVVLRFGHDLGYPELADAFGLGQGAVRMRISRAVIKMRTALVPQGSRNFGYGGPPAGPPPMPRSPAPPSPARGRPRQQSVPGAVPPPVQAPALARPASPFSRRAPSQLRRSLEHMAGALA